MKKPMYIIEPVISKERLAELQKLYEETEKKVAELKEKAAEKKFEVIKGE